MVPSFKDSIIVVVARSWIRYAPTSIFKDWLWRFAHWRNHRFTARMRSGFRMRGRSNDIVQGFAYYFGAWEPNLTAWMSRRLRGLEDAIFLDIGANVGYYSLVARSVLGKRSSVIAVEASPMIHELLMENLRLNGFDRIRTVNCAASKERGEITLFHGDAENLGMTTSMTGVWKGAGVVVEARPLHEILTADEIARVRLVKIDVEGAEQSVLDGMQPIFSQLRRDCEFAVEISSTDAASARAVFSIFSDAGFRAYRLNNPNSVAAYMSWKTVEAPTPVHDRSNFGGDFVFSRLDDVCG